MYSKSDENPHSSLWQAVRMSDRRKVLYVNHEVECGGAELSLLELLQGLDQQRFEPHLACSMEGPLTDGARAAGAEVHLVPMLFHGRLRKLWGIFRAGLRLRKLSKHIGIQLVHTNSMIAGYCGIFAAKLCSIPSVWHVRDISYPEAAKKICTQANRVVANSKATARSLQFPLRLENKIEVVYNGVGPKFFEQESAALAVREELHLDRDENLVGMVGRLDPWKGHADLLESARSILRRQPKTTFVIVGDVLFSSARRRHGNYREELETMARELGIFGKVRFLGRRDDVPRLMSAMNVVVHPSANPEPFGRSIAEAQAVGKPVVGSAVGGIPELIEDGVNGYLFLPGDVGKLAACVVRLLDNPGMAVEFGAAGRQMASASFTQGRHVEAIQAVYDGL